MQGADAIPFGGVLTEKLLRRRLALLLDGVCALAIPLENGIAGGNAVENAGEEFGARSPLNEVVIGPTAICQTLDQASLGHELEVPADARLALSEDAREILHVEFAAAQHDEQAQPRRLCRRFQDGHHCSLIQHARSSSPREP